MADPLSRLRRFVRELKRRNVYRVAVMYAVVGFVVIQTADLLFPRLLLPDWSVRLVIGLVLVGFPIALVVAWAFEMTPEGVRRTPEAEKGAVDEGRASAGFDSGVAVKALVGLGLLAAAAAGGWYLTGGGGETEPRAGERSIAVLPFENMGGEESQQFTRGVHDDLLTRLSNISELKVISRTSVLPYRETELSLPAIADSLGVRWIVEGGVQQAGGQVQVNAQLIQAEEDVHRWAETYRRELTTENLFAVQSELTKKIARSLEAELTPEETERVERQPTEDLDAYKLYVQGRTRLHRRTEPAMQQARALFQRALAQDSSYALAWSGLADAWTLLIWYGHVAPDTTALQALQAARRALSLNPDLAEAHTALGHLERFRGNMPVAVRHLKEAVELRPSYAAAQREYSELLGALGRRTTALTHAEKAVELGPRSPPNRSVLGWTYWWVGGPGQRALEQVRRASKMEPGYAFAHASEGLMLSDAGQHEAALAALRRGEERAQPESRSWALSVGGLGTVHARLGDSKKARRALSRLQEQEGAQLREAMVHAALGQEPEAFGALRNMEWSGVNVRHLRFLDVFDPLRNDERYKDLLSDIHSAWGLNPDGSLPDSVDVSFETGSDD